MGLYSLQQGIKVQEERKYPDREEEERTDCVMILARREEEEEGKK